MDDSQMQDHIRAAAPEPRVLTDTEVDALWPQIEAAHFDGVMPLRVSGSTRPTLRERIRSTRWLRTAAGIAAALVAGFGFGRFTAPEPSALPPFVVNATPEPVLRTTSRYLDDAALLLASLPEDASAVDARFVAQASQMLNQTRTLLDSPAATSNPRLLLLLEDLELVLAQVARLRNAPNAEDLSFIASAMNERDVVPRLRTVAAAMSSTDD